MKLRKRTRKMILGILSQPVRLLIKQRYKTDRLECASRLINWNTVGPFRKNYALGMILAAAQAECMGLKTVSVVEFGVGTGGGLLDMCRIAEFLQDYTEVQFKITGFDTGAGLPAPADFRDHPEVWYGGQFAMDTDALVSKLPANAKIIFGNVKDTVQSYVANELYPDQPLAFVSLDLDYYSSSTDALTVLKADAACLMPAVPIYVDDTDVLLTYSRKCGEALAIDEFNEANGNRQIEKKHTAICPERLYVCHVLDHPVRTGESKPVKPFEITIKQFSVGINPSTW